jgi:heat shock protein HtpX
MAAAYGLYTHIRANRVRSVALLLGLFLLIYVMVYAGALAARAFTQDASLDWYLQQAWRDLGTAFPFATAAAVLWILIAYKAHQKLIDLVTGGHEVTRQEQPRLYNLLENLCISRGIPMPRLKVADDDALNAFASGLSQKQYAITVTSGLLQRLDDAELEAVLGHELTHIRNGDVRMMVIAMVIAGVVGFVAELVFRLLFNAGGSVRPSTWSRRSSSSSDGERKGGGGGAILAILIAIALIALSWILSQVIRFALSRSREYLADAGAVELTKNPDAMITALRKIEGRGELQSAPSAVMEMCIDNPRSGFVDLFATHPAIDKRVDALVRFAGGHDPGPIALPDASVEAQETPGAEHESGTEPEPAGDKPFLPSQPPLSIGDPGSIGHPGPWGAPPSSSPGPAPPPGPATSER